MEVFQLEPKNYFGSACYIIEDAGEFALIDPSVHPDEILAQHKAFTPKYIILTHAHFDHMVFLPEYINRFPDASVFVCKDDVEGLTSPLYNASAFFVSDAFVYNGDYIMLTDGDRIGFANSFFTFYNFRGHTQGSLVISYKNALFTGDLIFYMGGRGRTDLISGNEEDLLSSISRFFRIFDDSYTIYPGHGRIFSLPLAKTWFNHSERTI